MDKFQKQETYFSQLTLSLALSTNMICIISGKSAFDGYDVETTLKHEARAVVGFPMNLTCYSATVDLSDRSTGVNA